MNIEDYTLVTLDFETYYGRGDSLGRADTNTIDYVCDPRFKIHCVGVKVDDDPVIMFKEDEMSQFEQFMSELSNSGEPIALLCHNTAFDAFILHHHFDWHPHFYLDTMSMSKGMFVGAPANLKHLSTRLWPANSGMRKGEELALSKDIRDLPPELMDLIADYCVQDVTLTYEAFKIMHAHFPDDEMYLIHMNVRMFAEPWFYVDTQLTQAEIDDQVESKKAAFKASGLPKTVLSSNQQFGVYLETQGYDLPVKENDKGVLIPALGQKDWPYLKFMAAHPQLQHVFEGRKFAKSAIQESRARRFLDTAAKLNGQMPVPLRYYGAHTGRYSGGEKLNLQNLPRISKDPSSGRLRKALVAPAGYSVIVSDLSNIEARILAWVSGQEYLLNLYKDGGDPYLFMASKIYGFNYDEALPFKKTTYKHQRDVGKVSVLGLGYGMGAAKFWVTMNTGPMGMAPVVMSEKEAQEIVATYRETNFAVVDYWGKCEHIIAEMVQRKTDIKFGPLEVHGSNLIMPNNMALQYPNLLVAEDARGTSFLYSPELTARGDLKTRKFLWGGTLTENIVQALARIIITEQSIQIENYLEDTFGLGRARTVHMVHDELIVIGPEEHAETIYNKMVEIMSTPPSWAPDLPLECEGGFAQNYIK